MKSYVSRYGPTGETNPTKATDEILQSLPENFMVWTCPVPWGIASREEAEARLGHLNNIRFRPGPTAYTFGIEDQPDGTFALVCVERRQP
jgi:hypothetical protein